MAIETEILQAFYALRGPIVDEFFLAVTSFGSVVFVAALLTGLYLSDEKRLSKNMFWAYGLSATITWSMKLFFGRARPDVGQSIGHATFNLSFPSGHASTAFMLAAVLAWRKPEARPYFYSMAVLVGISRLYLGVHHPSDVIVGAAVGYLSAKAVIRRKDIAEYVQTLS